MAAALHGKLQDFGIAEVFQLIGQQRKTGLLDVRQKKVTLRLAFDQGCVVWARPLGAREDSEIGERLVRCGLITQHRLESLEAESGFSARTLLQVVVDAGDVSAADAEAIEDLVTNDTVFTVLRWNDGSFDFSAQAVYHGRSADKLLHAEQILMDGLRMVDEWQTFAGLVPDGDTVFERNAPITTYKRGLTGEAKSRLPTVEKVHALVDGRLTAQRVIDLSRLGLFDATRALAELHQHDVIVPVSGRKAHVRRRESAPVGRPLLERAVALVTGVLPLVVLAALVSMIHGAPPPAPEATVFPIERAPLEDARQLFEKRRIQNTLEAQHLLSGRWPESLPERDATGLLEGDDLTPEGGAPYYYARQGDGIVLLAPER